MQMVMPIFNMVVFNEVHFGFCFMVFETLLLKNEQFLGEKKFEIFPTQNILRCLPQGNNTMPNGIWA